MFKFIIKAIYKRADQMKILHPPYYKKKVKRHLPVFVASLHAGLHGDEAVPVAAAAGVLVLLAVTLTRVVVPTGYLNRVKSVYVRVCLLERERESSNRSTCTPGNCPRVDCINRLQIGQREKLD